MIIISNCIIFFLILLEISHIFIIVKIQMPIFDEPKNGFPFHICRKIFRRPEKNSSIHIFAYLFGVVIIIIIIIVVVFFSLFLLLLLRPRVCCNHITDFNIGYFFINRDYFRLFFFPMKIIFRFIFQFFLPQKVNNLGIKKYIYMIYIFLMNMIEFIIIFTLSIEIIHSILLSYK